MTKDSLEYYSAQEYLNQAERINSEEDVDAAFQLSWPCIGVKD